MGNNGHSTPDLWGGYDHYNSGGHKTGHSAPGVFGGYTHYDANGHKTGRSDPGVFGGYTHYDANGHKTGHSDPGVFGGYQHHRDSDGCYIATCVYGSYDTPEVWTLRRFRDRYLRTRFWGRAFIRIYYAISPKLVAIFGNTSWFRRFWYKRLNGLVAGLHERGYDDSPYEDRSREKMK